MRFLGPGQVVDELLEAMTLGEVHRHSPGADGFALAHSAPEPAALIPGEQHPAQGAMPAGEATAGPKTQEWAQPCFPPFGGPRNPDSV